MNMNIDFTAIVIVSIVFFTSAVIVGTVFFFVHRANELKHQTIRMALEKGQPLPPELLEAPRDRGSDLARGVKLVFIGVGLSLFFWFFRPHLWSIGLIVLFVGLGHLAAYLVTRGKQTPAPPVS
jgi:hypothetical protein